MGARVYRAKVKPCRAGDPGHIWSVGGSTTSTRCVRCGRHLLPWWRRWRLRWFLWRYRA